MFEESLRPLKIVLGVFFIVFLAGLAFFFFSQREAKKAITGVSSVADPVITSDQTKTNVIDVNKTETSAETTAIAPDSSGETPTDVIEALDKQVNSGTLSPEEATQKIEAINRAKAVVPSTPETEN